MSGFEYGNARLRAMKSRLLTWREIEALAQSDDLQGIISGLTRTEYRKSIEVALAHTSGMDCIQEALHNNLVNTLGKIQSFYTEEEGQAVKIILQQYDIHNLKAILRGLSKNAPAADILNTLLPVGELKPGLFAEIARTPSPRGAIDLIASLTLAYAQPLMELRGRRPGADVTEMELSLEQWFHRKAKENLRDLPIETQWLSQALEVNADITNIQTVLRFVNNLEERKHLQARLGADIESLFVGPGKISFADLKALGSVTSIEALVDALAKTNYSQALRLGLSSYLQTGHLSELERQLRRFRLEWMKKIYIKDPLGLGVPLGFLALKTTEVGNLRWIASSIDLGLPSGQILAEVEFIQ